MIIEDQGIIVFVREFEEKYLIVQCFLRNHGFMSGLVRISKLSKTDCMPGNIVQATWNARLREHLGHYKFELVKNVFASTAFNHVAITFIRSALAMTMLVLHEKEKQIELFDCLRAFLSICDNHTSLLFYAHYLTLELCVLKAGGYGLALDKCVVSGKKNELIYISPKSGAVVSRECGKDYDAQLIKIPQALLNFKNGLSKEELYECLRVIEFFIEKNILSTMMKKMPVERGLVLSFLR